jgi:hypothetical protein
MAQEWAVITVGAMSAVSALAGYALNWFLSSKTNNETARREERKARRQLVEGHYLSVMSSLEHFLRASDYSGDIERELSSMNAAIDLFANELVKEKFTTVTKFSDEYQDKSSNLHPQQRSLSGASAQLPIEWKQLLIAKSELASAMAAHMSELRAFVK